MEKFLIHESDITRSASAMEIGFNFVRDLST